MMRAPLERASAVGEQRRGRYVGAAQRMRLRVDGYDRARVRRGGENGVAIRRDGDRGGRNHVREHFQLAGLRGSGAKEFIDGIRAVVGDIIDFPRDRASLRNGSVSSTFWRGAQRPATLRMMDGSVVAAPRDGANGGVAGVGNKERAVGSYRDFAAHGEIDSSERSSSAAAGRAAVTYRANSAYSCCGSGEKFGGVSGRDTRVWRERHKKIPDRDDRWRLRYS